MSERNTFGDQICYWTQNYVAWCTCDMEQQFVCLFPLRQRLRGGRWSERADVWPEGRRGGAWLWLLRVRMGIKTEGEEMHRSTDVNTHSRAGTVILSSRVSCSTLSLLCMRPVITTDYRAEEEWKPTSHLSAVTLLLLLFDNSCSMPFVGFL